MWEDEDESLEHSNSEIAIESPRDIMEFDASISRQIFGFMSKINGHASNRGPLLGLVLCDARGSVPQCYFHKHTSRSPYGTSRYKLAATLSLDVHSYFVEKRPRIKHAKFIRGDLTCQKTGGIDVPFQGVEHSCSLRNPRNSNEIIVTGELAQELADRLQGETLSSRENIMEIDGFLSCLWPMNGWTRTCSVHRHTAKGLAVRSTLVDHYSRQVSRLLQKSTREFAFLAKVVEENEYKDPPEIEARVDLYNDGRREIQWGRRFVTCRIEI